MIDKSCRLCGSPSLPEVEVTSTFSHRRYEIRRCGKCAFAFVAEPWLDFATIYDDDYYSGRGADPLVDYLYESEHPDRSVRRYEWRGVLRRVTSLHPVDMATRWLDYGCGTGGLVEYLREHGVPCAVGFEQGWGLSRLRARGVPHVLSDDLRQSSEKFDVITAIEVLEHVVRPIDELRRLRSLLRPGGLLFLTTGNAVPYRGRLERWGYVMPDVHISFFEPPTLALALKQAGFEVSYPGWGPGWAEIIRFKVLKSLRRKTISPLESIVPWRIVTQAIDRRLRVSAQPVGWAPALADAQAPAPRT